jgi:hypothetical protein
MKKIDSWHTSIQRAYSPLTVTRPREGTAGPVAIKNYRNALSFQCFFRYNEAKDEDDTHHLTSMRLISAEPASRAGRSKRRINLPCYTLFKHYEWNSLTA